MRKPQIITAIVLIVIALGFSAAYAWQQSQSDTSDGQNNTTNPSPTPTPAASQIPTQSGANSGNQDDGAQAVEQTVNLYLVAVNDNGQSGQQIGCGDSLVPVTKTLTTATPLSDAVKALLAIDDEHYGQSGLYNALWQSDIQFESANIDNGQATVELSGDLKLSGACDNPRVQEQLEATITQFNSVNSATILLNGQSLSETLSGK